MQDDNSANQRYIVFQLEFDSNLYGELKMTLLSVIRGADHRRICRLDLGKSYPVCPAAA